MVIEILKARIKVLIREKDLPFWGILFPIFLTSFLYLGTMLDTHKTVISSQEVSVISEVAQNEQAIDDVTLIFLDAERELSSIVYFLSMLAICCMIMGLMGNREMEDYLSAISAKGIRVSISPVKPSIIFGCGLCASWGLAIVFMSAISLYMKCVLKIGIQGPLIGWILLITLSALCGVLFGMIVGALSQYSRVVKQAEIAVLGVGSGVLAGLVDERVKFYVDAYLPIITKMNPTSIMVEGMFTLSVYGMTQRFRESLMRLGIVDILFFFILILIIRRKKL